MIYTNIQRRLSELFTEILLPLLTIVILLGLARMFLDYVITGIVYMKQYTDGFGKIHKAPVTLWQGNQHLCDMLVWQWKGVACISLIGFIARRAGLKRTWRSLLNGIPIIAWVLIEQKDIHWFLSKVEIVGVGWLTVLHLIGYLLCIGGVYLVMFYSENPDLATAPLEVCENNAPVGQGDSIG